MACNLVRKQNGEIHNVFTEEGKPSILYNEIDQILDNKEASYSLYLELLYKSEDGQLNSLGNFAPKNSQGELNLSLNPRAMALVSEASNNIPDYVYKTKVLENQHRREELNESITNFLHTIGVTVNILDEVKDKDGNTIDAVGSADLINKIVNISKTKKGEDTLGEEAAHFMVELLRADENPLYKSMYRMIEGYEEYQEMLNPDHFQFQQHGGNIDKLKREAIGKVISKHIFKNDTTLDSQEKDRSKLSRLKRWFDRVLNFFNKLLGKINSNPYQNAAHILLNNKLDSVLKTDINQLKLPNEIFYQENSNTNLTPLEKLERDQALFKEAEVNVENNPYFKKLTQNTDTKVVRYQYVGPAGEFEPGQIITKRMSDAASIRFNRQQINTYSDPLIEAYNKAWGKTRQEAGNNVHRVMEDLVNVYAGNSKETIADIQNRHPEFNRQQFLKLSLYANDLVKQINTLNNKINKEEGTTGKAVIRTEMFLMNRKETMGGTMDLIAFFNDGSAAIFDYKSKVIDVSKAGAYINSKGKVVLQKDVFIENADNYSLQIGQYKSTLLNEYGVTKIRQSRVIPIILNYKLDSNGFPVKDVNDVQIGVEDNPFLEQLPVAGEETFIKNVDKLIIAENRRLDLLINQRRQAKSTEIKRIDSKIMVSRKILQRLQLDQNVDLVIIEADRLVKRVVKALNTEEEFLVNGEENIDYMDETKLLESLNELKHFDSFTAIKDLVDVYRKRGEDAKADELETRLKVIGYDIKNVINLLKDKMVERLIDLTEKEGIKGIDTFNRKIGYTTANWVSRSNQSHPALRFIHKLKSSVEAKVIKIEKELASEIAELQNDLIEWGNANGYPGASVYDALLNQDTMSLHTKFNSQFTIDKKKALQNRDLNWMQSYYEIDEELYDKKYEQFKANAFRLIEEQGGGQSRITRERAAWVKKMNPKKSNNAWFNSKNPFIKPKEIGNPAIQKYLSKDYIRIQQTPALKNFYDFHIRRTKEFLDVMGIEKNYNFIANVHKGLVDQLVESGWNFGQMGQAALDNFQMREHEMSFGVTDLDGNFVRHIPRYFTNELVDSEGRHDPSLKSKELGKSLYLLGSAAYMHKYLNEIAPELLMMEALYKEGAIEELLEDKKSHLVTVGDKVLKTLQQSNLETITDFINAELFGQHLKTPDAVKKVMGKDVSRTKTILQIKQYHTIASLGLRGPVALAAFGAGFIGLQIQAAKGMYITKKNLFKAEKAYFTKDPKVRAIFEYFEITLEDMSKRRADLLSSTVKGKLMTTDRWFEFLARADRTLDAISASALAMNYGVHPETGKLDLLKYLPEGTKSLYDIIEIKENPKWTRTGTEDKYITKIPGVENLEENNNNWINFRQKVDRIGSKVKGAVKSEDRYNSQNQLINRLFMHYRSWLPGIAFERFGALRYDHVMENFDQGTWNSLFNNIGPDKAFDSLQQVVDVELGGLEWVQSIGLDLVKIGTDVATFGAFGLYKQKDGKARLEFEAYLEQQQGNPEFDFNTKEEKEAAYTRFIDMKQSNIKGAMAELRAAILLALTIFLMGKDWDDDGEKDIRKSWSGRQLYALMNRTYREVAFFWDPTELTGPRATGIPLVGFGKNIYNFAGNTIDQMGDDLFGQDENPDRTGRGYYAFKMAPGLSGIANLFEIYKKTE